MSCGAIRGCGPETAADGGTGTSGRRCGIAPADVLEVERLADLGDTPTAVIAVLRIYAAHGFVVVCARDMLVLSPGLPETVLQWKVRRALAAGAPAEPARPRRVPAEALNLRRTIFAESPSDRGRSGPVARVCRWTVRLVAKMPRRRSSPETAVLEEARDGRRRANPGNSPTARNWVFSHHRNGEIQGCHVRVTC